MQNPSPLRHIPSTPVSARHSKYPAWGQNFRPLNSSPLVSPSSPQSSPVASHQARRRSQYKSRAPTTPITSTYPLTRAVGSSGGSIFASGTRRSASGSTPVQDPQQNSFLRERFKARCLERVFQARAKAVKGKRYYSEASSDGFDETMDEDEEESDDAIMQDELFRRIVNNSGRKDRHSFRVSYAHEVGSSFDPDMEDIDEWQQELLDSGIKSTASSEPLAPAELSSIYYEDEELEAYAEEYAKRAALAEFEDLAEDELFSWSDVDEVEEMLGRHEEDVEML